MKKALYFLAILFLFASCASETGYVVKGKIEGSDSIMFKLQKRVDGKVVTIDSAISKKGSFVMKAGAVDYPQQVQLVAIETNKRTSFYLENSVITVTGTLDSLFKAVITGSKTQDEHKAFVDSNKPLSDAYSKLFSEYTDANKAGDTAKVADIEKTADSIQKQMTDLQKNFVRTNTSSYVTPSILASLRYEMEASEIEEIINALDTSIAKVPQIVSLKEIVAIMKTVAVGQKAPDFTLNDVNDTPVALSSKFGTKLLLVDFWAGWCGPCRQENPNVVKVWKEFNKKGFDVYGVSLDHTKDEWLKAIAEDNLTWTNVYDQNVAAKLYGVNAIPSSFLLDETGTIIARNLRGDALYDKVNEVLGKK